MVTRQRKLYINPIFTICYFLSLNYFKGFVEIVYAPIFGIPVTNNIFVTPVFNKLYPKFGENLLPAQTSNLDLHSLMTEDKNEVRRLASCIDSLLEFIGAKEDIFYMGPFSSILAGVLEHLPSGARRKVTNFSNNFLVKKRSM